MAARGAMRHRATIQRDGAAGSDDWGNPAEPDWQDHLTELSCRAWFNAGKELAGTVNAVVEDRRMIIPVGTDVTEADRVTAVTDRQGNPIPGFEGTHRIEVVGGRRDHLILFLEAI